jgi:hypothetical protein
MPQKNFPLLISVDWLSVMARVSCASVEDVQSDTFMVHPRSYGSKQFHHIADIDFVDADACIQPFGVFCYEPTLDAWDHDICSLKLANSLFYCNGGQSWQALLTQFLVEYSITITSVSRCDLACDFLFLQGRVSGPQLVERLKTFQWWKCGSVVVSEHYKMPYSVEWSPSMADDGAETDFYLQQGAVQARVESMTFGTMSSDAQVIIYDKSLELARTDQELPIGDTTIKVCAKEYIRDAQKAAGVWSDERHTWRIEIRLKNKACFLTDTNTGRQRSVTLSDLTPEHLPYLFQLAAQRYFRLVDATQGGTQKITPEYCASLGGHKNRLPLVHLFPLSAMSQKMSRKKYQPNATRFTKAVVNCLERNALDLESTAHTPRGSALLSTDAKLLAEAARIMRVKAIGQYVTQALTREDVFRNQFERMVALFNEGYYTPRPIVANMYRFIHSNRYIPLDYVRSIVKIDPQSNFTQWVRCNFNIDTYNQLMKIPSSDDRWIPPVIAPEYQRKKKNITQYLLT